MIRLASTLDVPEGPLAVMSGASGVEPIASEELEFLQGSQSKMDLSLIYPTEPTQLPKELEGAEWPPKA